MLHEIIHLVASANTNTFKGYVNECVRRNTQKIPILIRACEYQIFGDFENKNSKLKKISWLP